MKSTITSAGGDVGGRVLEQAAAAYCKVTAVM